MFSGQTEDTASLKQWSLTLLILQEVSSLPIWFAAFLFYFFVPFWLCFAYVLFFFSLKMAFLIFFNHLCLKIYCSDLSSQRAWNAWWNRAARDFDFACSDFVLFLFLLLPDDCQVNRVSDCTQMYETCMFRWVPPTRAKEIRLKKLPSELLLTSYLLLMLVRLIPTLLSPISLHLFVLFLIRSPGGATIRTHITCK